MARTVLTRKELFEKRNKDDIFIRDVIGGLLRLLNNRLSYTQVWSDEKECVEKITVPFYYEIGNPSGERFLQDNYLTFGAACGFKKINGNFDMLPRGMISLESAQIESDAITNRFVKGEFQREDEDGVMRTYVSWLYSLPMTLTFSCEVRCSSFTEMLKITEACNKFFYKNKTYYIVHRGMKLGCRVGFPESFLGEKGSGYTMGGSDAADKVSIKQPFELRVECYQPVFDESTVMLKGNVIGAWASSIDTYSTPAKMDIAVKGVATERKTVIPDDESYYAPYVYEEVYGKGSGELAERMESLGLRNEPDPIYNTSNMMYLIDDWEDGSLFPSGAVFPFRWSYRKADGTFSDVVVEFEEDSGEMRDEHFQVGEPSVTKIAVVPNHLYYDWEIPSDFTGFKGTDVVLLNDERITVYREPRIKVIPDPRTGLITNNSLYCTDPGFFICPLEDPSAWDKVERNPNGSLSYYTHIAAELSYEGTDGKLEVLSLTLPIKDGKLETCGSGGVHINLQRAGVALNAKFGGEIPSRTGKLVIRDATDPALRVELRMTIV